MGYTGMNTWRVNVVPYLGGRLDHYMAAVGQSVADVLGDDVAPNVIVYFGALELPREKWASTFPASGGVVSCIVENANLGSTGKSILRLAAFAALTYFTAGAGATWAGSLGLTGWGATAAYAGAFVLGSMAINQLLPAPTASASGLNGSSDFGTLNAITGTSNQINPYGPVPVVIGVVEDYFPPHAAQPYLENSGDDQYLRLMLDIGLGANLAVSNLRIGSSPIDQYDDVQWELTRTPTLYTSDVSQESLAITMADSTSYVRTTQEDVTEIGVDFSFLKGLYAINSDGDFVKAWNYVTVNFRKVGTTTWYGVADPTPGISTSSDAIQPYNLSTYKITSSKNAQLRVGLRWQVTKGQYEVQVTTGTMGYAPSVQHEGEMTWSLLTSFSPYEASQTDTLKLAMRIRATDQLNGVIQNLSCRVAQQVPTWSSSDGWSDPVETKNPAWFSAWLLKGADGAVKNPRTDDQIDLPTYATWASQCDAMNMEVGYVIDTDTTLKDALDTLFTSGRSKFGMLYNAVSPTLDREQQQAVQMFTPANCDNFQVSKTFQELPHAVRVTFTSQDASSQKDEMVVYAPGYSKSNATRFETMDLTQSINPAGVWHIARYHLRVMRARPNQYSLTADIEHFPCQVGKLCKLAFPIIDRGLQYGRVVRVEDGRIVLDQPFVPEPGKGYALRIRRTEDADVGDASAQPLVTWDTTYITFDMTPPYPTAVYADNGAFDVQAGDLYVLGEAGKLSIDVLVKNVQPSSDLNATITFVDAAPEVLADDDATAPAFVSTINHKRWNEPPSPPSLRVGHFKTSADNAGVSNSKGSVGGGPGGGLLRLPSYKQAQLGLLPGMGLARTSARAVQ